MKSHARLLAAFSVIALTMFGEAVAATSWPALITTSELRPRLTTPGLRIVDLRGSAAYAHGHADGAVSMPFARWKDAAESGELPSVIGAAGIHPERPLLLVHYDTGIDNFAEAAWIAWELKIRGIRSVSLLEGGMAAWQSAGIRQTERVHRHRTYRLDYPRDDAALVQGRELEAIRDGWGRLALVRSRTQPSDVDVVPVVSLAELLDVEGGPVDRAELLERVKNAPVTWGAGRVGIIGDTPEAAAAFWFLASEVLGIDDLAVVGSPPAGQNLADLVR